MDVKASRERTSTLLRELSEADGSARISVAEIVETLRNRAYGLLLIVFGAPCMIPAPPPLPLICGTAVALVAASMVAGRVAIWLPGFISRRTVPRPALRRLLARILPGTIWLEKFCKPRLLVFSERAGKAVFGTVMLILGLIVTLPIPVVGNITPGLAIIVTGIGLSERDGLVMGLGLSAVAIIVTSAAGWATIVAFAWAF